MHFESFLLNYEYLEIVKYRACQWFPHKFEHAVSLVHSAVCVCYHVKTREKQERHRNIL